RPTLPACRRSHPAVPRGKRKGRRVPAASRPGGRGTNVIPTPAVFGRREPARETRRSKLPSRRELPEVFGTQVLQVLLELLGATFRLTLLGIWGRTREDWRLLLLTTREERFVREDGSGQPQRHRNAVRRARIDLHHLLAPGQMQLREVRALHHARDLNPLQRTAKAHDHTLAEVVRERTLAPDLVQLKSD